MTSPSADRGRLVPVAEGDVVGAGGEQLFAVNQPGADQPIGIAHFIDVVAVRGGELPARRARPRIGQRRHVGIVEMGVAPDLQLEFGKQHGLVDIQAENADVGNHRRGRRGDRPSRV